MTSDSNSYIAPSNPPRLMWVDFVKGQSIAIVVFLHVMRGLQSSGIFPFARFEDIFTDAAGAISMPMFFFMSGMFVTRAAYRDPSGFFVEKVKTVLYPYIVWVLIHGLFHSLSGSMANTPTPFSEIWRAVYAPPWHYWFVYVMFMLMVFYTIVGFFQINRVAVLAAALVGYILLMTVNLGSWGPLYLFLRYLPFFALGAIVNAQGPVLWLTRAPTRVLVFFIAIGYPALLALILLGLGVRPPAQMLLAIPAGMATMSLAILLERYRRLLFIEEWGRRSLAIYVAHIIPLAAMRIILQGFAGVDSLVIHITLGFIVGIYGPIALAMVLERLNFPYLFTLRNPAAMNRTTKTPDSIQATD